MNYKNIKTNMSYWSFAFTVLSAVVFFWTSIELSSFQNTNTRILLSIKKDQEDILKICNQILENQKKV